MDRMEDFVSPDGSEDGSNEGRYNFLFIGFVSFGFYSYFEFLDLWIYLCRK